MDDDENGLPPLRMADPIDAPLLELAEQYAYALVNSQSVASASDFFHQLVDGKSNEADDEWNWAGNVRYGTEVLRPTTIEALQVLVKRASACRVIGSRHSFSLIAKSSAIHIAPALPSHVVINALARTVTCGASMTFAALAQSLHLSGWALHNMASLPHISVVGAIATATHGSGDGLGNLTTLLLACRYVDARGRLRDATDAATLQAVLLGGLGVLVDATLRIEPSFAVRQDVYLNVPWAVLLRRPSLDKLFAEAYSAKLARRKMHPISAMPPAACTEQGVPGPWHERLPHFRADESPSSRGDELQSEYFVRRQDAPAALAALRAIGTVLQPLLQVSELRVVAADGWWLSPAYGRDVMAIHFTWIKDAPRVIREALPAVEEALAPFGARPHWGKLFSLWPARVAVLYPRLNDYRAVLAKVDPNGKFVNDFVRRYVLAPHVVVARRD